MPGYILAIDQGTTGSTVVALSPEGEILAKATHEFAQHYPRSGWVEHVIDDIWRSVTQSLSDALEQGGLDGKDCLAIGITNQRETVVVWDRSG